MHRETIEIYEREGADYAQRRGVQDPERVRAFSSALPDGGLRLDLGCGPGHHLPLLGPPAVALDAAASMITASSLDHPEVPAVRGEVSALPFGRGSFAGVWASKVHQHVAATDLPSSLAEVHRVLEVGGRLELTMFAGPDDGTREEVSGPDSGDDLPGRFFTWWAPDRLVAVVEAAGFDVDSTRIRPSADGHDRIELTATARLALPDHVSGGMRLLCCGLNPSVHAAEAGVGYVSPSNRFWPAMALAGLTDRLRDPRHLLVTHGIGMTDLVRRPTPRASDLTADEFRAGLVHLRDLCTWLEPSALAVVGLSGWRAAVDRRATVGWQPEPLGPTPVYLLPSTSGLNAHVTTQGLADHLAAAAAGPP